MFILRHLIDLHIKQRKKDIFATFIDFEKAFDTIWRYALLYKLLKTDIHRRMFKIIRSMYSDTYYGVKYSDGHTPFFLSATGIRQGCNLSPILFNLFLNDITELFSEINGFEKVQRKLTAYFMQMTFFYSATVVVTFSFIFQDYINTLLNGV